MCCRVQIERSRRQIIRSLSSIPSTTQLLSVSSCPFTEMPAALVRRSSSRPRVLSPLPGPSLRRGRSGHAGQSYGRSTGDPALLSLSRLSLLRSESSRTSKVFRRSRSRPTAMPQRLDVRLAVSSKLSRALERIKSPTLQASASQRRGIRNSPCISAGSSDATHVPEAQPFFLAPV
jgi:hypothetical protein